MGTESYLADLIERAAKTFAQAFIGVLIASNADVYDSLTNFDTLEKAGLAGIAAAMSVVSSLLSKAVGKRNSASALPEGMEP